MKQVGEKVRHKKGLLFSQLLNSLFVVYLIFGLISSSYANTDHKNYEENYAAWVVLLDRIDFLISDVDLPKEEKLAARFQLEFILEEVNKGSKDIQDEHKRVEGILKVLGEPHLEEEPNAQLLAQYLKFSALDKDLKLSVTRFEFIKLRAENLLTQLQGDLQTQRWSQLLFQNPLPFLPSTWQIALPQLQSSIALIAYAPIAWVQNETFLNRFKQNALFALSAYAVMVMIAFVINRAIVKNYIYRENDTPSFLERLIFLLVHFIGKSVMPFTLIVGAAVILIGLGLLSPLESNTLITVVTNVALVFLTVILTKTLLVPPYKQWRIFNISDIVALNLRLILIGLSLTLAISGIFSAFSAAEGYSQELDAVLTFIFGGSLSFLLIAFFRLLTPENFHQNTEKEQDHFSLVIWSRLRVLTLFIVSFTFVATFFGYSFFAKYILLNLIISTVLLMSCLLLRSLLQEIIHALTKLEVKKTESDITDEIDRTKRTLVFVVSFSLDAIVFIIATIGILSVWGVPPEELFSLSKTAINGFQIGDYSFSFIDLGLAVLVFVIMLVLTRSLQWIVADKILPQTRVDIGVRHSIKTGTGYVGLVLGAMIAISVMGIDLSNLAIVAGALSVGIGFGLQTMVNNFISGLILLIERPIKVGDWVVVGDKEGHVKHINVRATEITTFQKATIIIPNSEILSGSVVNWTHKDIRGRIDIPVGVAYGTDVEKVRNLLTQCANDHTECLNFPEPFVIFTGFGASSLDFELRFFVRNVDKQVKIRSDVLFLINETFEKENIEIPFTQQVLHFADQTAPQSETQSQKLRQLRSLHSTSFFKKTS